MKDARVASGRKMRDLRETLGKIKMRVPTPGPKARMVIEKDRLYTSPCYTRYVTLVVKRALGCMIEDVDGNVFLDFTAGIAVNNVGHCNPLVVAAARKQMGRLIHMCSGDYYNEPVADLAKKLAEIYPGEPAAPNILAEGSGHNKVFFTNSGTESVEAAIKLARHHAGRQRIIAFRGAFHGRTMGSCSMTASKPVQRQGFGPFLPGVEHATWGDLKSIRQMFATTTPPSEVAAIFTEVIQGEGGYREAPEGFIKGLREICDEHGILLVADEVQSGFGRTGDMFAIEAHGVVPDMLCCAKGIAGGLPLGALIARPGVMTWPEGAHGSTFGGNPVSCAAALASIELIQATYMRNARVAGKHILDRLNKWRGRKGVMEFGGRGLMIRVTFETAEHRDQIIKIAFEMGLILLPCGQTAIRICPPLCITRAEVAEGMDVLDEAYAVTV